jgi:hypothetical protein
MYCHLKGKKSAPRQDLYLIGTPRSPSIHVAQLSSTPLPDAMQARPTQNVSAPSPSLCLMLSGS